MPRAKPTKGKAKSSTANPSVETTTITTTTIVKRTAPLNTPTPTTTPATKRRNTASSSATSPTTVLPPTKKTRQTSSIALKAQFIMDVLAQRELDPKASALSVARWEKYGFSKAEVSRLLKNQEDILEASQQLGTNAGTITKLYPRKMAVVEDALFGVFQRELEAKLPVNDGRLKELAFQAYVDLMPELKASMAPTLPSIAFSDGWLTNFKKSRGIRMQLGHGEEGDVDWKLNGPKFAAIAQLLVRYHAKDVFNCDETGLYLKVLKNWSLSHKRHVGRKPVKEARVTVMLCCNALGTDKIKPFVLSKNRPNGISKETEASLRCHFRHGYVNSVLFKDWLLELDAEMEKEGRHIALLLDNAPGHGKEEGEGAIVLKNIELIRLPPKTTSVSQPLDAGIIRSFKVKYSRHMIRAVSEFRRKKDPSQPYMPNGELWACLASAWDEVTPTTIRNCFAHVPTLPKEMRDQLRMTVTDEKDSEMDKLKQEMEELYPERAKEIAKQKDYGVLAYLKSCEGRGPNQYLLDAIRATAASKKFRCFFEDPDNVLTVDEDDDDDEDDLDYVEETIDAEAPTRRRTYGLRNGEKEADMVAGIPSSQESAEDATVEAPELAIQEYEQFLDEANAMLGHIKTHYRAYRQVDGTLPTLPPLAEVTSQMKERVTVMRDYLAINEPDNESWLAGYNQYTQNIDTIELSDSERD